MIKILNVIVRLQQAAGTSAFCAETSRWLSELGVECSVSVQTRKGDCYPLDGRIRQVDIADFAAGERLHRPDIVHIHALWSPFIHRASKYSRLLNLPIVHSPHGMLAPWAMKHKRAKKTIAWWLYQRRDLCGASMFHVTAACEIEWLRHLGFRQPCAIIPLGASLPELSMRNDSSSEGIRGRGGAHAVKTVLFLGRLYPVKGLMNLIRAWACLKRGGAIPACPAGVGNRAAVHETRLTVNGCAWQLVLAGPDQAGHQAELIAEACRLGLSVRQTSFAAGRLCDNSGSGAAQQSEPADVLFTGSLYGRDKDAVFRMADLFALPSFSENFGAVVTEALSYGIPVITTKGTPWAILEGRAATDETLAPPIRETDGLPTGTLRAGTADRCGWWVDIGVAPLGAALRAALLLSDHERRMMGMNGRRLVEARYTWPAVAGQMKTAYEWLLEGGRKPDVVHVG